MPHPDLRWFESDGTTPLAALDLDGVGPGETYSTKYSEAMDVVLKNTGGTTLTVTVVILPVAAYPANEYLRIAEGATEPDANEFVDHEDPPLSIGSLAPDATARVWIDVIVPAGAPRELAQLANLDAVGA